jgi:hypothetical protein
MSLPLLGSGSGHGSGGGGGGGGGLPPVTGLLGWWDASVTASMTLASASVINMADQSGNGNHLGDGSAVTHSKPQYDAAGFNSRGALVFSAAACQIKSTSAFPMGTGNTLTYWVVGTMLTATQNFGRAISYTASGASHDYDNDGSWLLSRNGTSNSVDFIRNSSSGGQQTASISLATNYRLICTVDSGGAMKVYVNNSANSGTTRSGNWVSNGEVSLGMGAQAADSNAWDGAIAEAGVATGYSDATAVAALDSFLQARWGL